MDVVPLEQLRVVRIHVLDVEVACEPFGAPYLAVGDRDEANTVACERSSAPGVRLRDPAATHDRVTELPGAQTLHAASEQATCGRVNATGEFGSAPRAITQKTLDLARFEP